MSSRDLTAWSADGKPSRSDFGFAVLALLWAALQFSTAEAVSWGWIAIGFVVWAISFGPVAVSPVGRRLGAWFETVGTVRLVVAMLAFFALVWVLATTVSIPVALVTSFVIGGFVAMFGIVAAEAIRAYTDLG